MSLEDAPGQWTGYRLGSAEDGHCVYVNIGSAAAPELEDEKWLVWVRMKRKIDCELLILVGRGKIDTAQSARTILDTAAFDRHPRYFLI